MAERAKKASFKFVDRYAKQNESGNWVCNTCGKTFTERKWMANHLYREHQQGNVQHKVKCPTCGWEYGNVSRTKTENMYAAHRRRYHSPARKNKKISSTSRATSKKHVAGCPICGEKIYSSSPNMSGILYEKHLVQKHGRTKQNQKCPECGKWVEAWGPRSLHQAMYLHVKRVHPGAPAPRPKTKLENPPKPGDKVITAPKKVQKPKKKPKKKSVAKPESKSKPEGKLIAIKCTACGSVFKGIESEQEAVRVSRIHLRDAHGNRQIPFKKVMY